MAEHPQTSVDPRSGSSKSNSTFYSKRKPLALPTNHSLDITTFISSQLLAQDHDNNKVAFIDASTGRHLSFADVWKGVETVSTRLSEMGIRKGDVVLLLSPNSIFFPIVCLSVMSLGAIITPANPLNTAPEIAKQISDSKATLVPQFLPKLSLVPEGKQPVNVVLMSNAGDSISIPDSSRIVVADTLESMMKKKLEGASGKRAVVTQDDMATLLYSSGTTGASKGVVLSHGNLIALIGMAGRFRTHEEDQIYIATIPMSHSFGFSASVLRVLAKGCTVVVLTKFGMHKMLSAVEKYKVTYLPLVPPILVAMANHADAVRTKYNLECLRYVLCGGAPLSKGVMDLFWDKCPGITILQGYALTESAGAGASIETAEESRRYGTAGLITPSTEAKIVDTQTGEALPPNRAGELWLRGPPIMKGYFGNAKATASALTSDGWLRTGDLCYIDDDGFVFVVDRLKELIKYKGHQVPPAELESLLLTHPEIADAAVIPFPDDNVGQYQMAYVVRKSGSSVSDCAIMEFVAKEIYGMPMFDDMESNYTSRMHKPCPWWLRPIFRALFGYGCFFVAVAIPFLGSVSWLVGGIAVPVTFSYPCFLWLKIKKPKKHSWMWCLNWGLGLSGILLSFVLIASGFYVVIDTGIHVSFFRP